MKSKTCVFCREVKADESVIKVLLKIHNAVSDFENQQDTRIAQIKQEMQAERDAINADLALLNQNVKLLESILQNQVENSGHNAKFRKKHSML